nr:PREDICTED: uncharacterized protein LOC109044440 [Bemisia tabaci]
MRFKVHRVFIVFVVMCTIWKDAESKFDFRGFIKKHDGGWFYKDKGKCQERCNEWYGMFKIRDTEDTPQPVAVGKVYKFKCICHSDRNVRMAVKRAYSSSFKSGVYRVLHFAGFGNQIKSWYKKIQYIPYSEYLANKAFYTKKQN